MPKFPPMGVTAVVDGYRDYLTKMGGMSSATSATHSAIGKLGGISLGGIVAGAGAAAAAVTAIGLAAAAVGIGVGKVLYDIAEKSAFMIDIEEAFNSFTGRAGKFADEVIAVWQEASSGVITNIDLMSTYNTAVRRLGDEMTEELPKAFPLLKKAAESSGDSFAGFTQKLINGIGRLRVAQLSQLGIEIDLAQLTEDYAKAQGIKADAVSKETQRSLVFAESLKQLQTEFGDLVPVGEEADDVFERIQVDIKNAKDTIKVGIAEAMIPLAQSFEGLTKQYLPAFTRYMRVFVIPALGKMVKWIADRVPLAVEMMGKVLDWAKTKWAGLSSFLAKVLPGAIQKALFFIGWLKSKWGEVVNFANAWIIPTFMKIKDWVGQKIQDAVAIALPIWDKLKGAWKTITDWVVGTFLPAWDKLKEWWTVTAWPAIRTAAENAWDTVKEKWEVFRGWFGTTFMSAWAALKTWIDTNWPGIQAAFETAWDTTKKKWEEFSIWYTGTFLPAMETQPAEERVPLSKSQQAVLDFWNNTVMPAWETIVTWIEKVCIPAWQATADLISAVVLTAFENLAWFWNNTFKTALDGLLQTQKDIRDALGLGQGNWDTFQRTIENIGKAIEPLVQWVHDLADDIRNMTVPKLFQGNSPSPFEKTLKGIKGQMLELRAIGMPSMGGAMLKALPAGAAAGGSTTNFNPAYNLAIHTSAPRENIVADFGMMQALSRRR